MNSILLYVGHELLMRCFPVQFWVPETHAARLSMQLWGAILWAAVAFCLHRSGVYLAIWDSESVDRQQAAVAVLLV